MRSVSVVLPASMWAMMPMFRVRDRGICRVVANLSPQLPAVVGKSLVRFRHLVSVFFFLNRCALVFKGGRQFGGQFFGDRFFLAGPGRGQYPTDGQGHPAFRTDFNR